MNYVIIGNSTAAVGCIEQIRKTDQKGKITVISDEPYHTYGRPLISYYLLGRVDAAHMNYRPADFYEKNGVKTLLGVRAERIDLPRKRCFCRAESLSRTINCSLRRVRDPSCLRWTGTIPSKRSSPS